MRVHNARPQAPPSGGPVSRSPAAGFSAALAGTRGPAAPSPARAPGSSAASLEDVQQSIRDRLAAIADDEREIEAAMRDLQRGRAMSETELLQLQDAVYRYSESVEIAARVIDKGAAAVKQLLNIQL